MLKKKKNKIDILALKWQPMNNIKKTGKYPIKINLFFHVDFFKDFGGNLNGFWPPSCTPQN